MRAPLPLTVRSIEGLDLLPEERDAWIWDSDSGQRSGLGLRLRRGKAGVSKTFYAAYRFGGQDRRDPIGDVSAYTLADARHRAYEHRRAAADGNDPREAKAAKVRNAIKASGCPIFADYTTHYLARRKGDLRPNTFHCRTRYLTLEYCAPLHKLRLDQIDKAMIASRLNFLEDTGIAKASVNVAKCVRIALIDLFKLATSEGLIEINPAQGTPQRPAPEPRKRTLSDVELAALWNATGDDGEFSKIVRLLILLGARRNEIGGMAWSEFDGLGNWTLPEHRSKTGNELRLPLSPAAREIINSIERRDRRDCLFGGSNGFSQWSGAKKKLDARLPLVKSWTLHDLRRSMITSMHELNIEPHIIRAIVNHSRGDDVHGKHYNHATYMPQKATALQRWADHVQALADGKPSNVVPLRPVA
ncbi:MAG TPA: integrase arm-type DNA-binding domain-containing protein [Xanthobacteraceae bacterium]